MFLARKLFIHFWDVNTSKFPFKAIRLRILICPFITLLCCHVGQQKSKPISKFIRYGSSIVLTTLKLFCDLTGQSFVYIQTLNQETYSVYAIRVRCWGNFIPMALSSVMVVSHVHFRLCACVRVVAEQ